MSVSFCFRGLLLNFSNSQNSQRRSTECMQISEQTHSKHTGQKKMVSSLFSFNWLRIFIALKKMYLTSVKKIKDIFCY